MKPNQIFALICYIISVIVGLMEFIVNIAALASSGSMPALIPIALVGLGCSICMFVFGIIHIAKIAGVDKTRDADIPGILGLYFVPSLPLLIYAISVGGSAYMGVFIAVLMMFVIVITALIIAVFSYRKYPKTGSISFLVGLFLSLILIILSFAGLTGSTINALTILELILVLGFIVCAMIKEFMFLATLSKKNNENTSEPVLEPKPQNPEGVNEKLKQLKDLLDQGLITPEEYEEKRKKYIETL